MPLPSSVRYSRRHSVGPHAKSTPRVPKQAKGIIALPEHHRPPCEKCGKKLIVLRNSKNHEVFWSCPRYPICKYSRNINQAKFKAYRIKHKL